MYAATTKARGVATELTAHITNAEVKQGAEKIYQPLAITAGDLARGVSAVDAEAAGRVD
jgi:hypothetical protein